MTAYFQTYIETAKAIVLERGLEWNLNYDEEGRVTKDTRWNLTALVGLLPPPTIWLGRVGVEANSFAALNEIRSSRDLDPLLACVMSEPWLDLYKAVVIHQLCVKKNKPMSGLKMSMPVRQLAAVAGATPPWRITPELVRDAYNSALADNTSGKVAMDFKMMIANVLDGQNLCTIPNLARFCTPSSTVKAKEAQQRVDSLRSRQNTKGSLRRELLVSTQN
ncbi:hypothetical protein F4V91_10415 [Neorhizobium galegae]|uniref:Uncharacterized protein n=1 Tax=Neorhizobium galegae TaxID=399 RepID=A0A6A1TPT6_NEOGA|nr:hypothetical protein [Neorhizobium galegae]KAB1086801.1 hypothetical protein F4V91_10415 [Neorhizobium galegae]